MTRTVAVFIGRKTSEAKFRACGQSAAPSDTSMSNKRYSLMAPEQAFNLRMKREPGVRQHYPAAADNADHNQIPLNLSNAIL